MVNSQVIKGFEGNYPIGSTKSEVFISKQDLTKQKITFFTLAQYDKDDLNQATRFKIDDPIITENRNLDAELLYACERNTDHACNLDSCSFVSMDGRNIHDFSDDDETCNRAFNVTILEEQYLDLIKPVFS